MQTQKVAVIAFTETHLHKNILDTEVQIKNYELFRQDRKERSHGGVAAYIETKLAANAETVDSYSNGTCEFLAVHIKKINIVMIIVYRPPNTKNYLRMLLAESSTY